jgi:hypothetical protein
MYDVSASNVMPRTTIDLDATVLRDLKDRGRREGKSLGQVASELLAQSLRQPPAEPPTFTWTSKPMRPHVDLEDKEAVYRALDDR